jgi:DNA-binding NarL/FixJ family response regulator
VVLGEAHLRRVLAAYAGYYNELRTHPKTPRSIARSSVSARSHHDPSLAAFTTNIAESNIWYAQVVRLLARGMSNKVIAHSLGIADITGRLHLRNAFRKMGAGNRADAVRIAMRSGLFN